MPNTLLRVLRATIILLVVATGMVMNTEHRRAQANTAHAAEMCRRYAERRPVALLDENHPQIRRMDTACGFRRDL